MTTVSRITQILCLAAFCRTPLTRWFGLKAWLLRAAGYRVHPRARVVSSVRFLGDMPVYIGEDTWVGHEAMIFGGRDAAITIGDRVDIAPRVTILSGTHVIDPDGPRSAGPCEGKPVTIEDGVWIGAGTIVLPGVRIGRKAVIGAGSVVTRDIPPGVVAVGSPCRPIRPLSPG